MREMADLLKSDPLVAQRSRWSCERRYDCALVAVKSALISYLTERPTDPMSSFCFSVSVNKQENIKRDVRAGVAANLKTTELTPDHPHSTTSEDAGFYPKRW